MPTQNRRSRQDALQTLYPEVTTTDSINSIMAEPDEEPLRDELCELAAAMCDIDFVSIEIIKHAKTYDLVPQRTGELKTELASMCSDAKLERDYGIMRYMKFSDQLGSDSLFSKGYLCNTDVVRYLKLAAKIAVNAEEHQGQRSLAHALVKWGLDTKDLTNLPDLAKDFCMLSIKAAGETELGEDVLKVMKSRLIQLDRLIDQVAGPRRMRSWRTIMVEIQRARNERVSKSMRHSQMASDWTSTLVAISGVTILLAMVPTYMAWTRSPYSRGSTSDSDFWWLIQSSIMALLSLLTLSIPIYENSRSAQKGQTWFWTWWFISAATVAALLAPVLYVLVPTAYSGATVFVASACQAFVVLQLSLAASVRKGKGKGKEKMS